MSKFFKKYHFFTKKITLFLQKNHLFFYKKKNHIFCQKKVIFAPSAYRSFPSYLMYCWANKAQSTKLKQILRNLKTCFAQTVENVSSHSLGSDHTHLFWLFPKYLQKCKFRIPAPLVPICQLVVSRPPLPKAAPGELIGRGTRLAGGWSLVLVCGWCGGWWGISCLRVNWHIARSGCCSREHCVGCFMSCYLNKPFCIFGIYFSKYYRPLGSWSALGKSTVKKRHLEKLESESREPVIISVPKYVKDRYLLYILFNIIGLFFF